MSWLQTQLKKLVMETSRYEEEIKKINSINSNTYNEFHNWTPLKLVFLHYSLAIYSAIIHNSIYFDNMFYVDLFAGSGINKTKKGNILLIGSPLIATLNYKDKYTKFFFCENDPKYNKALTDRLNSFNVKDKLVCDKDCNAVLDKIIDEIAKHRKYHSFFFIDPFAMEFEWKSMKKVLGIKSDIVFVFMTSEIRRAWSSAKSNPNWNHEKISSFFGNDLWKNANNDEDLINFYKKNILDVRKSGIIETVKIKGKKFSYDIFFITNKTKGGNRWLRGINKAKKEIESNTEAAVKTSLDILTNKQSVLNSFFK